MTIQIFNTVSNQPHYGIVPPMPSISMQITQSNSFRIFGTSREVFIALGWIAENCTDFTISSFLAPGQSSIWHGIERLNVSVLLADTDAVAFKLRWADQ